MWPKNGRLVPEDIHIRLRSMVVCRGRSSQGAAIGSGWRLHSGNLAELQALGTSQVWWGDVAPHHRHPHALNRFELSPRMREACLIVKTHLGHPGAAKSKEVVSGILGWDGVPSPCQHPQSWPYSERGRQSLAQHLPPKYNPLLQVLSRNPKTHVDSAQAMLSMCLGNSGSCLHPPPLE